MRETKSNQNILNEAVHLYINAFDSLFQLLREKQPCFSVLRICDVVFSVILFRVAFNPLESQMFLF